MSRILVAEDDPHILRVICFWLLRQGHTVLEARNGLAALALFDEHSPDIIVTDVNMPGLTGLELLDRLCDRAHRPSGVIVLTNRWDHREIGESLAQRGVLVMPKPFSPTGLAELISQLAVGRPAAELAAIQRGDLPAAEEPAAAPDRAAPQQEAAQP